jgi:hypothetical protein
MNQREFVKVGEIKVAWHRMADGRTCIDPRRYGLPRQTFKDHTSALNEAERIARERHNNGAEMTTFTSRDRAELLEARKRANGFDLLGAIAAGVAALARPIHKTIEIAHELLESKQAHDLNKRYRRGLTSDVLRFARAFPDDLSKIEPADIDKLANSLGFGVRRRNAFIANVRHIYSFAAKRNRWPADKTSPAHQVEIIEPPSYPVEFFAVWEMELFLEHVREPFVPWLAINSFSGARIEEIVLSRDAAFKKDPLRWEDFDWDEREIAVRPETSKTGRARRIPILDNLFEILRPWKDRKSAGPVCALHPGDYETRRIVIKANAELARNCDRRRVTWRKNALRHSYGSYRMAMIQNENQLSYEMGNSVEMIRAHYHNPRPKSEAAKWFNLQRSLPENIVQLEIFG